MRAGAAAAVVEAEPPHGSLALQQSREPDGALTRTTATPAGAFHAARRTFLKGRRIDMRALANELGTSRPTLYRWTGPREQLLSDVVWSLSDEIFEQAKRANPEHTGAERLLRIYRAHVGALVVADPLHAFLRQEPQVAMRVLTSPTGGVQHRTIARLAELYREEEATGAFQPRADVDSIAYAVVRLTECFIYNDALASVEPAAERASEMVALLLE